METTLELKPIRVAKLEQQLPDKTDHRYQKCYDTFIKWSNEQDDTNGTVSFDENILLTYFTEASKTLKRSSLWSMYSMLRKTISRSHKIDISVHRRLLAFLKEKSIGYESKRKYVFSADETQRFLTEAPDEHYLGMKTILVFGVCGGCNLEDFTAIKTDYLTDYGTEIIVNIPAPEASISKLFVINGDYAKIVQKYMSGRPSRMQTNRFFLQYNQGECERQVLGKNKISIIPKEIAKCLQLEDYKSYTIHSFQPSDGKKRRKWKPSMTQPQIFYQPLVDTLLKTVAPEPLAHVSIKTDDSDVINDIIIKTEYDDEMNSVDDNVVDIYHGTMSYNTTVDIEPVIPLLSGTMALMKRKSEFYTGIPSIRLQRLLQLADEMNLLSEVKLMLTLRKLRLNEEFEVLGVLFNLDRSIAERYHNESKEIVTMLVNRLATTLISTTTPTAPFAEPSKHFDTIFEPVIKIEKCEGGVSVLDPIAVEKQTNDDSIAEMTDDDDAVKDEFDIDLPKCSPPDERGWLHDSLKKRTAECTVCHRFYVPRLLKSHLENVHFNLANLNRTICGLCFVECDTEKLLRAHQKEAHHGGSHGCDICSKVFASKRYLSVHIMTRHTQAKTYLCDICGEGFAVPFSLQDHVKRKHMVHGHNCHSCHMKFVTSAALKDHFVARHTDERRFTCEFSDCGKRFKWRSSFKSHRRVHANDKYECSVCLKWFSFKGNLRHHLKIVHNQIVENRYLTSKFI